MNVINWLISICSGHAITVGSRVMTPRGMGTITGGSVQVSLDCYSHPAQRGIKNQTFQIEQVKVK